MTVEPIHLIILSGEIDMSREHELRGLEDSYTASHACQAEVHLGGVTFLDSNGLRFLATLLRVARTRHGTVVLVGVRPEVGRVLQISGLDPLFERRGSGQDA